MALGTTVVWEVRSDGNDLNGGAFDPISGTPGTDYSQQAAPQITFTDLVIDATTDTNLTSAANPFTSAHVGNAINITSGTGFTTGRYRVVSVASNVATMDRAVGTVGSTGGNGRLGGALATLGTLTGAMVAGNDAWIRAATYDITSVVIFSHGGGTNDPTSISGYSTTRGDGGRPTIRATAATSDVIRVTAGTTILSNFIIDGNDQLSQRGLQAQVTGSFVGYRLTFKNCTNIGAFVDNDSKLINCEAVDNDSHGFFLDPGAVAIGCTSRNNAGRGFELTSFNRLFDCVSAGNTGTNGHGYFQPLGSTSCQFRNCVSYGNSKSGWHCDTAPGGLFTWMNCISYGNSELGWGQAGSVAQFAANAEMIHCAAGANPSGNRAATPALIDLNFVTLTADPFVNAASNDFDLNSVLGGGAACRAAGFPGTLLGSPNSTGYADIGAFQHQDSPATNVFSRRKRAY